MTFKIQIKTDSAAFEEWQNETARILRQIADALDRDDGRSDRWTKALHDINGNSVGYAYTDDSI